jgi:hypothetical protein
MAPKTGRNPLFAGRWFEDEVILLCLRWYFRFKLSYRDLVQILSEHRAQQFYDESIEVLRRAGETWGLGIVLAAAAGLRIVREDYAQARVQASEALSLCQELEDPRGIAWSLEVFAGLLAAAGLADGAARLWVAAEGLLESVGGSLAPSIRWVRDCYIEPTRTSLGDASFKTARTKGRALPPVQAIVFALQQALLLD